MPNSFYAEQLAKAVKAHPRDYNDYVEKAKRGKVVPFSGEFTSEDAKKLPKRLVNTPYREFGMCKQYIAPKKPCKQCGTIFEKKKRQSYKDWDARKFCGQDCLILFRANERT